MRRLPLFAVAAAMILSACGGGGMGGMDHGASAATDDEDTKPTRTVDVAMVDIAFAPTSIKVEQGETIRFVFTNNGKLPHDAFIGDTGAQADHETEMRQADAAGNGHGGGHGGGGDSGDAITVESGQTGELTRTFKGSRTIEIGCHQAGHYAAGMKITVAVA